MIDFALRILITVFSLGIVVVIHEWGHFLVARRLGVRVERFTVGFGPEIFGWTRGDTRYAVCVVPLGGMVKMAGEFLDEHTQKPDEFFSQPWYGRAVIALAGPVMNYLLAFVLFAFVAFAWGTLQPSVQPVIGDLVVGLPAAEAHLQVGDQIRSINGIAVTSWEQMAKLIHERPDQPLRVNVERPRDNGRVPKVLHVSLTPRRDPQHGMGLIGIKVADEGSEDIFAEFLGVEGGVAANVLKGPLQLVECWRLEFFLDDGKAHTHWAATNTDGV